MINVSNAFKNELYNGNLKFLEYVDITLSDKTVLNLTNNNLWNGGLAIEDAVSNENSFDIGAAIINKCTLSINNIYDNFSDYDFNGAKVIVYIGLELPGGKIEKIRKGTYTVDEAKYNGSVITLSCLDNMTKFDQVYSKSTLKYPATLNAIVRDACTKCGVTLQTYDFPHDDFIVQSRPNDEAVTFREVIMWCAQIAGCFCRCDTLGRLELKWYNQKALEAEKELDGGEFDSANPYASGDTADGGSFEPWNNGYSFDAGNFEDLKSVHHIYSVYSSEISTDDVVITGITILEKSSDEDKNEITTYTSGSAGYVISIENNELIKNGAGKSIAGWLGEQLIGLRFRKATIQHSSDPTIEAGDVGILTDRKQRQYRILVSTTAFSMGSNQKTVSAAETPVRNSAKRFSESTKNYVDYRKEIAKEKTEREKALEELGERLDNASGLFTTEQKQPDGSTIFYMHDKPSLDESQIVWKMTAEAWGVSTDGGKTWNAGMTVDGDTIVRILTAVGINADWINTGLITDTANQNWWNLDTGEALFGSNVKIKGTLEGASGSFEGSVSAQSGNIGGWNIKQNTLVSSSGNMVIDSKNASIRTQRANGNRGAELIDDGINLYSWSEDGHYLGSIRSGFYSDENKHVFTATTNAGDTLMLQVPTASNPDVTNCAIVMTESAFQNHNFDSGITLYGNVRAIRGISVGDCGVNTKFSSNNSGEATITANRLALPERTYIGGFGIIKNGSPQESEIHLGWTGTHLALWVNNTFIGYVQLITS